MFAISPARSPGWRAGHALGLTTILPFASRCPNHQPSSMFTYSYPALCNPDESIARACSITMAASTVFEKLFQEDQPMGGR